MPLYTVSKVQLTVLDVNQISMAIGVRTWQSSLEKCNILFATPEALGWYHGSLPRLYCLVNVDLYTRKKSSAVNLFSEKTETKFWWLQ